MDPHYGLLVGQELNLERTKRCLKVLLKKPFNETLSVLFSLLFVALPQKLEVFDDSFDRDSLKEVVVARTGLFNCLGLFRYDFNGTLRMGK